MPFSNGSSYEVFKHNVCERCIHWELDKKSDTWGCPLMDVFILFSYGADYDFRQALNMLCDGRKCSMFKPIGALGQKRLTVGVKR